jgi:hypothetical protein
VIVNQKAVHHLKIRKISTIMKIINNWINYSNKDIKYQTEIIHNKITNKFLIRYKNKKNIYKNKI